MSLIEEFNKEIGLKSFTELGLSSFGTRVMNEPFMLCKQILWSWKSEQRA
jgi:hypothetical protein